MMKMTNDLRIVIDTGVVVSASMSKTTVPRQAINWARQLGIILISDECVEEFGDVFRHRKLDRFVREETRMEFLAELVQDAEWVEITKEITECRDPKDDKFLELAVNGNATHIITGDKDLLVMNPFRGIAIVTPQEFLATQSVIE